MSENFIFSIFIMPHFKSNLTKMLTEFFCISVSVNIGVQNVMLPILYHLLHSLFLRETVITITTVDYDVLDNDEQ